MNEQNQKSTQQTSETQRDERGATTNKVTAWAAGIATALTFGGLGVAHARANQSPDNEQGRVEVPAVQTVIPGQTLHEKPAVIVDPGPTDSVAPSHEKPAEPVQAETTVPAPATHADPEPEHHAANSGEAPVVINDNNMTPTPEPTPQPTVINDNNMAPTPSPTPGEVVINDNGMNPQP